MIKQFVCSLLFIGSAWVAVGQDYIVNDSVYSSGTVRTLSDGSIRYRKLKIDATTRYTADQIKEFGVGEKVFESVRYHNTMHFAERLAKINRFKLLSVRGDYLIKKNDSVQEVKRADLRVALQKHLNCSDNRILKKALSTKKSIAYNVRLLLKECAPKSLRFNRTSLSVGISQFDVTGDGGLLTTERVEGQFSSPYISIGKEIPFYKSKNLFLTTDLIIHMVSGKVRSTTYAKGISAHYIWLPVGIKWELPTGTVRPFWKGGFIASYSSYDLPTGSSAGINFGLTSSLGLRVPIQTIHALQLEIKRTDAARNAFSNYELGMSATSVSVSYNF